MTRQNKEGNAISPTARQSISVLASNSDDCLTVSVVFKANIWREVPAFPHNFIPQPRQCKEMSSLAHLIHHAWQTGYQAQGRGGGSTLRETWLIILVREVCNTFLTSRCRLWLQMWTENHSVSEKILMLHNTTLYNCTDGTFTHRAAIFFRINIDRY